MNFYELKPTNENVSKTLVEDSSKRRNLAVVRFIQLLNKINTSCSISLDGNWGSGKTFFVKQVQMLIDASNGNLPDIQDKVRNKIEGIMTDYDLHKLKNQQFCVYFDAWKNDASEEPILALIYEIIKQYHLSFPQNNMENLTKFGKNILDGFSIGFAWNMISINSSGLVKAAEDFTHNPVKCIEKEELLHQNINNFLEQVRQINDDEKSKRLVIFIDELDRCRPTFALNLLERIKHYFDQEYITFVFSTNMKELSNTVKAYYGMNFDAERYLDKFFDLRLQLPKIDMNEYIHSLVFYNQEMNKLSAIFKHVADFLGLEMREITRLLKIYEIAANHYWAYYESSPINDFDIKRCKNYILPLLIGLKMTNKQEYEDFIEGKKSELFTEFLSDSSCDDFFYGEDRKQGCSDFYKDVFTPDQLKEKHKLVLLDSLTLIGMFSDYQ